MMNLTIGKLAANAGVNVETIRYYERRGLIDQPVKPGNGFRRYDETVLDRIIFIKKAQGLGFKLDEIKNLLSLSNARCSEIQTLAEAKLGDVQLKIRDLKRLETVLADLVRQCNARLDKAHCPIIEVLLPDTET
jgi:MerR family mercuric resistance operon transcriptional regulator